MSLHDSYMDEAVLSINDSRQSGLILCNIALHAIDCVSRSFPIDSPREYIRDTIAGITVQHGTRPYDLTRNDQLLYLLNPI
jgi:hypothetical protein